MNATRVLNDSLGRSFFIYNMTKKQRIIFISGLVIILLFLVFYQAQKNISQNILSTNPSTSDTNKLPMSNVSLVVEIGDTKINIPTTTGGSLYSALTSAQQNNQITFSGKNYPGLGFFVTDIGSLHSRNGKNLIYYVNGKEATVGVSSFIPQNGDVIVWKLQ